MNNRDRAMAILNYQDYDRLPIVHWEFVPDWDGLDVKCVPKGSGSENMTFLKMLVPADGAGAGVSIRAAGAAPLDSLAGAVPRREV